MMGYARWVQVARIWALGIIAGTNALPVVAGYASAPSADRSSAASADRLSTAVATESRLTVFVNDPDWPPFNITGGRSDRPGITKEIAKLCFQEMGVEAVYRALPIERMQTEIQQGTLDINFFSYKKEREAFVAFSKEPVFRSGYRPIVKKGSGIAIKTISDFDPFRLGHTIGLRYSNEFLRYVETRRKQKTLDETATVESNLKKLLANRIDVFAAEYNSILYLAERDKVRDRIEVLDFRIQDADYFMALSKKSPRVSDRQAFLDRFDRCVRDLKTSGRYCQIFQSYGLPCPFA